MEGILSKAWPLIMGIVGYAVSWIPAGIFAMLGVGVGCTAAFLCWWRDKNQFVMKDIHMAVRVITTILAIVNLIELL